MLFDDVFVSYLRSDPVLGSLDLCERTLKSANGDYEGSGLNTTLIC